MAASLMVTPLYQKLVLTKKRPVIETAAIQSFIHQYAKKHHQPLPKIEKIFSNF